MGAVQPTDPHALNGKLPAPEAHYDVVVIGAGPSGIAAAVAAAGEGRSVLLVDEHPVPGAAMGNDVPLFFGGRMTPATLNAERMLETVFMSEPALEAAMEAGVELLLGTCAWGVYRNGAAFGTLPQQVVGLADAGRSWLVGFDRLVLATGARDLAIGFPGWNQPGVMGAAALTMLLSRYDAFAGKRVLFVGSHDLALETALLARDKGVAVAGLIEVRDAPQGRADLVEAVRSAQIAIHTGDVVARAEGGIDGVERAILRSGTEIACDTICLGIGLVPCIELLDAMGGGRTLDPMRGGYIPAADQTIGFVGDCAGLPDTGFDHVAYRMDWAAALGAVSPADTIVCQCEEVTRGDLIGVQPPNYLARPSAMAARSLGTLIDDGLPHPDQIKRLTRAAMGVCQGRRCRDQVAMILALEAGKPFGAIPLASHRAPVRPLPLRILADWEEADMMRAGWDVWFGIPTQWIPYRDIGTPREQERLTAGETLWAR
ncbi:NAD(P)/FAD-dependent oxidoreductase [Sphingomonas profundi]|uniref:NAD(P)/FAD-dependent oxidoreductase n=1 Tax=Alterirhizorhabdus profundi TaxID=2681549 RepID=UPI0012E7A759|nr:NAD(P)/FAD-dependent oxidoreductase [Sphingomonas profundi]